MAKKSKSSNKSKDSNSVKPKATANSERKSDIEAVVKSKTADSSDTSEKSNEKIRSTKQCEDKLCFKGFFAKKYEEKESILTIFKKPKFYGALLGEVLGTMFLGLLLFSLLLVGLSNISVYAFALIAILIGVYAFSGACLNPIVAIGMMATRRISVIRGIMYIVAEIIGAWLAWLIFSGFHLAGGETAYDIPTMSTLAEGNFWPVALVEIMGAIIIAFFFARALKYKRSALTFGAVVAGGVILAILVGYIASAAFLGVGNNFIMNPAVAMMLQIFPTAGADFGEIVGGICQALSLYAILPMLGGVVGFYLADFASKLSFEE